MKERERECDNPAPENGGQDCGSERWDVQECPIDGGWTDWTDYLCDNGRTVAGMWRSCTNPEPSGGGKKCEGEQEITYKCPVDGWWGNWGPWAECTGNDIRTTRTRKCDNPPSSNGGRTCYGPSTEYKQDCGIDGNWAKW